MDETPILGNQDERKVFQQVLGLHGPPAFMRRAQRVQQALDDLLARCRKRRDEWLVMVRIQLGTLQALSGDWEALRPLLSDTDIETLRQLTADLQPQLRAPVAPTSSERVLRRALAELQASSTHFNQRWSEYLETVDLGPVNEQRDGYNRWYVIEKECAVKSPRVARQGFTPLPPFTRDELRALLPLLPVVSCEADSGRG